MSLIPSTAPAKPWKYFYGAGALVVVFIITIGVFASNGWLPRTDPITGKKIGWFGHQLPANTTSSWNPFAAPLPNATPSLSKEYIYAGSRLLAVEDANATVIPPADLAVWRPSSGTWHVLGGQGSQSISTTWGQNGDQPIPADFDGDGKTDFSIYRQSDGTWQIFRSSDNAQTIVSFGAPCWISSSKCERAVPADFDGDGKCDYVVYRPTVAVWVVIKSSNGAQTEQQFGANGDIPIPADFDGDGKADYAVWRGFDGTFRSMDSSNPSNIRVITLGQSGDKIVPANYDGDGKADHAVWRPSTGEWIVRRSSDGQLQPPVQWGQSGDITVQNDYDGDGKCDFAVYRPATLGFGPAATNSVWRILNSGGTPPQRIVGWGVAGDIPVAAFYRR